MGVTALRIVMSGGNNVFTGVPPDCSVIVSGPITTVVVVTGIGITVVELERTKVSEIAEGGGNGFGSMDDWIRHMRHQKKNVNRTPSDECIRGRR